MKLVDQDYFELLCKDKHFLESHKIKEGRWISSNDVFPIIVFGETYVVKRPRRGSIPKIQNKIYGWQSFPLTNIRRGKSVFDHFSYEAEWLRCMEGEGVPKLVYFDEERPILIRSYVEGRDFRSLKDVEEKKKALEKGLDALVEIHENFGPLGETHIKNIVLGNDSEGYWTGACFCAKTMETFKREDLLKFVFSTYVATGDMSREERELLTLKAAEMIETYTKDKTSLHEMRDYFLDLNTDWKKFRWWFSTRMPLELREKIKQILK